MTPERDLPSYWMMKTMGEVAQVVGGSTPKTSEPSYWGGDIAWITPNDLSGYEDKYISHGERSLTEVGYQSCSTTILPPKAVLFTSRAPIGYVAIAQNEVCTNQGFKSFICGPDVDPDYVYWYLKSAKQLAQSMGSGTTFRELSTTAAKKLPIPVPPLEEQHQIVGELEKQVPRLDAAVTALRRMKGNLKRYKSSVLQAACTGQLVPTEAGMAKSRGWHYEPADQLLKEILADREITSARAAARLEGKTTERPYRQPLPPNLSALPTPPDGWTWASVDQLAAPDRNSITDGPFGSNLKTSHYTSSGPRVIRLENIGDGAFVNEESHISEEHYANLMKHHVESQDLVIAALGKRLPRSCLVPGWLGPAIVKADCIRFKPSPRVSAKYLNYALNAEPTRQRAMATVHGVGRPRLNLGEIKEIAIPLPPTAEQERIVEEVDRRLSLIEELEAEVDADLVRAARLQQSILTLAFSGRLMTSKGDKQHRNLSQSRAG